MDFRFFEALRPDEAREYLRRYLEVERVALASERGGQIGSRSVADDESEVVRFFTSLAPRIKLVQGELPPDVPAWVRSSMEQFGGARDFDPESRPLVLRASFYLGESFVRTFPKLHWATGREHRAEQNQPVVSGFGSDADLPVLLVSENLLLCADAHDFAERVQTAVETWRRAVDPVGLNSS